MSLARKFVHAIAVPLLFASAAQVSQAQTVNRNINFDDRAPYLGRGQAIETGYGGLNWSVQISPIGMMTQGNPFYTDIVCRSGSNCGHNGNGAQTALSSSTSNTPITLSGWIRRWNLSGGGGSATHVRIQGIGASGGATGDQTFALTADYQQFSFTALFTNLRFTPVDARGVISSGYFLIDDLIVNPTDTPPPVPGVVPEPSTYALMATGLIGLASFARRRRAAQG